MRFIPFFYFVFFSSFLFSQNNDSVVKDILDTNKVSNQELSDSSSSNSSIINNTSDSISSNKLPVVKKNANDKLEDTVKVIKLKMNTDLSEISADFSGDYLYFFRNKRFYHRLSKYYDMHRILKVDANKGKSQRKAQSLSNKIKGVSHYHEGPAFVMEKENKIFLTINAYNKADFKDALNEDHIDENRLRIVEADFKNGNITNIKEFPFNDPTYSFGHATYSKVTQRLYFSSTRRGGKGGSDIYYSQKLSDGGWLEPVNVGRRINTDGEELFPYVKDTVLFFATNKAKGKKGKDFDIYFISEYDILLSDPQPMPWGINSEADDFAFCFQDSADRYIGYFTSNRNNIFDDNDDIYFFNINRIKIEKKYALTTEFISQYGEPIDSAKIQLFASNGELLFEEYTNINGKASFYGLTKGKEYKVVFTKGNLAKEFPLDKNLTQDFVEESFQVEMDAPSTQLPKEDIGVFSFERKTNQVDNKDMTIIRNDKDRTVQVRLKNIHFALNSAEIFPYSARKLDFIIEYFRAIDAKYVLLEAHTDSRGSDAYNLTLSEKRALSCSEYLIQNGIPKEKIKYKGMGESQLLNKCSNGVECSDEMHLENRRIEFKLGY